MSLIPQLATRPSSCRPLWRTPPPATIPHPSRPPAMLAMPIVKFRPPMASTAGPFRIRVFQQNLGYIQIYPDISVGTFSPSNVRAKRKTLLERSRHDQALRGKTDEHEMLLRAGCRCLQNGASSESLFRSPCSTESRTKVRNRVVGV